MSYIRIKSIKVKNYRSFGEMQEFNFPDIKKPISIVGYNNAGKSNLMNAILYCIQTKWVSIDTFSIDDFHTRGINNVPFISLEVDSSEETKFDKIKKASLKGFHLLEIQVNGGVIEGSSIKSLKSLEQKMGKDELNYHAFGANRYFPIYYINFHKIKEEIQSHEAEMGYDSRRSRESK